MRLLDQLEDWQGGAMAATRDLSGRTLGRLVEPLISWPTLSAPMAEAIKVGAKARVIGYPNRNNPDELRAERIIVDGKTTELR